MTSVFHMLRNAARSVGVWIGQVILKFNRGGGIFLKGGSTLIITRVSNELITKFN